MSKSKNITNRNLFQKTFLFFSFIVFIINTLSGQTLKETIKSKSIASYQDFLIKNPETPFIIEITDTLRQLWDRENIKNYHCFCNSNCIELLINSDNELLLDGEKIKIQDLKELILYSIENPDNKQNLPEKEIIKSEFGTFVRSKGIIDIITKNINSKFYSETIIAVKSAFVEIRKEWAKYFYDTDYDDLNKKCKEKIDKLIPVRIRFERYMPWNLRLPLPPSQKLELKGIPNNE